MTLNAFPYPGNKARHSEWIIQHFPEHECYVELFGGAAGVLFNKPRSKIEVYNDLNGDIPHFFRVLRERCDELQEWLRNVPYSRELYDEWADSYYSGERTDDDIKRAGKFLFLRYAQFGGKIEDKVGFAATGGSAKVPFKNKVESLEQFRDRLREVVIENKDWKELIESYDSEKTVFYADPPYQGTEDRYQTQLINHNELAKAAKTISGKVAISYDNLPPHYDEQFTVDTLNSDFKISAGDNKNATEYLIMNYDSAGEKIMSDVGQQTLGDCTPP